MRIRDLKDNPLADGEELNLIGYSGGGEVVVNVAEKLKGTASIDNLVLIGALINGNSSFDNVGSVTSLVGGLDPLASWDFNMKTISEGWIGHTDYFKKDNIDKAAAYVAEEID